jgi:hypothetical protein
MFGPPDATAQPVFGRVPEGCRVGASVDDLPIEETECRILGPRPESER